MQRSALQRQAKRALTSSLCFIIALHSIALHFHVHFGNTLRLTRHLTRNDEQIQFIRVQSGELLPAPTQLVTSGVSR